MKLKLKVLAILCGLSFLSACTSTTEKNLNEDIAKEPGVYTPGGVAEHTEHIIKDSSTLTDTQKQKLLTLHEKTRAEMAKIRFQMGKLKGTFFKTLIASGANSKEIDIMKKKLTTLNNQKMDVMLSSLEEAKGILGNLKEEKIYETFMYEEAPHQVR